MKCHYGKLASPVREPSTGFMRRCKVAPKSHSGKRQDYKKKSSEAHEIRYRKDRRRGKR